MDQKLCKSTDVQDLGVSEGAGAASRAVFEQQFSEGSFDGELSGISESSEMMLEGKEAMKFEQGKLRKELVQLQKAVGRIKSKLPDDFGVANYNLFYHLGSAVARVEGASVGIIAEYSVLQGRLLSMYQKCSDLKDEIRLLEPAKRDRIEAAVIHQVVEENLKKSNAELVDGVGFDENQPSRSIKSNKRPTEKAGVKKGTFSVRTAAGEKKLQNNVVKDKVSANNIVEEHDTTTNDDDECSSDNNRGNDDDDGENIDDMKDKTYSIDFVWDKKKKFLSDQEGDANWEDVVQFLDEVGEEAKVEVKPFASMVNNAKGRLDFNGEKEAIVFIKGVQGKIDGVSLKCHLTKPVFLKLKNVPKLDVIDDELLNFEFMDQIGMKGAKIVRKRFNMEGGKNKTKKASCGTLVISVSLSMLDELQKKKFVFGLWKQGEGYQFRGRFEYDIFVPFCSRCKQWGHFSNKCKNEAKCDCGKIEHEGNCTSTTCVNCGGNHQPWNRKKCGAYKELVSNGNLQVNRLLRSFRLAMRK